jgi:tetratricopeptide (TPR) repeat protein
MTIPRRAGLACVALAATCHSFTAAASALPPHRPGERAISTPTPPPPPPQPTVPTPSGPTVTLDDFLASRKRGIGALVDAQIIKMRRLVEVTRDDDPQKPDFWFRLAELFAEQERAASDDARALDEPLHAAPPAQRAELAARQRAHESRRRRWQRDAVAAYLAASRFPTYERQDEVLFRLAWVLRAAHKADEARTFLLRLLRDHPASRYVPDAYLAFADLYFDAGDMNAALKFYEKVEQFPRAAVYPYGVYKKGWCQVNLGAHADALATFVSVVGMARAAGAGSGGAAVAQKRALERGAKKDVVRAYARVASPDRAWDFFRRVGGDDAPKMMEALAELYWEQGQAADSTRVYRRMIALDASRARLCAWQTKIVRNTLSSGSKREQVQELERLGAVHDAVVESLGASARAECRDALHDTAKELAIVWHKEAQRTKNRDTFALDRHVYELFLSYFPADADAYELGYFYGELLWTLEAWRAAAEQYTKVVEARPDGRYVKDAAYAAVLAWQAALGADPPEPPPPAGARTTSVAPRELPDGERRMLSAFDLYLGHVPDAPERVKIEYRKAHVLYEYDHYAEAAALFAGIVERHPDDELAIPFAANLLLDCLNALGRPKEVAAWVDRLLELPRARGDAAFLAAMIGLKSDALDIEARAFEHDRQFKECGRSMLAAAEAAPAHEKHAERLWNAAQCFQNAHLVGQAIGVWSRLVDAHGGDVLGKRALLRLGAGYQQLAYYAKAADSYEAFAKKYPGEPEAAAALANATTFREGLGEPDAALGDMASFVGFYDQRRPHDAAAVFFQMAEVHERSGDTERLRAHLEEYLAKWARRGGLDREVEARFRLGELAWRASCPRPAADGACVQTTRVTSTRGQQVLSAARRRAPARGRTQCGPPTKAKVVVLPRDGRLAARAREHLAAAVQLWAAGDAQNPIAGRDADARRAAGALAAAGAAFTLAEGDYEALLGVPFPTGLDFSRPSPRDGRRRQAAVAARLADSNRRFTAYLGEKARLLERARREYLGVFERRQARWTIAAAARIGQLHRDFADQLYTAEIPKDLPEADGFGNHPRDLYCDALEDEAGKVEAKATAAFGACLAAATSQAWFSDWSRLCERELNQLEPARFPLASEIAPEAAYAPTRLGPAPPITTLP